MTRRNDIVERLTGVEVAKSYGMPVTLTEQDASALADIVIDGLLKEADVEIDWPLFAASFPCGFESNDYNEALIHAFKCPTCENNDAY